MALQRKDLPESRGLRITQNASSTQTKLYSDVDTQRKAPRFLKNEVLEKRVQQHSRNCCRPSSPPRAGQPRGYIFARWKL